MIETFVPADVDAELVASLTELAPQLIEETPFRILLMGDWSGRANRKVSVDSTELALWRPRLVDRDNLDRVIERLGVKLHLPIAGDDSQSLTLTFTALDDFHPDRIFERVELFETLRRTRAQLMNSQTFAEAAREVRGWSHEASDVGSRAPLPALASPTDPEITTANEGSLLDQILGGGSSVPRASERAPQVSSEIDELVREAVKPYLVPANEADRDDLLATVDARVTREMNAILHHPDFQALEAAWRALDFLVTRLDTDTQLKLYVLDISFDEFKRDLREAEEIQTTALYKILVEQTDRTTGGIPWSVVAANYTFDFASGDPGIIEPLSLIARESHAPFIAGATSHLLGCDSLVNSPDPDDWQLPLSDEIEQWWSSVCALPSAKYIGLALPRFLLRLPYGKQTEPTEGFDFEELGDSGPSHDSYLWANGAFAVAYLLGKGFSEDGWSFRPSDYQEIDGLPLHIYAKDGESEIKPCAEVLLTMRAAEKIIERGLMPLLSIKRTDTIRVGIFQSVASTRLAGTWS